MVERWAPLKIILAQFKSDAMFFNVFLRFRFIFLRENKKIFVFQGIIHNVVKKEVDKILNCSILRVIVLLNWEEVSVAYK